MATTFSIVTPVYNGERFLSQTIESILSQKGSFCIDYIVIDDGSTDGSLAIIKQYADLVASKQWNTQCLGIEMRYETGPNRGQSRAYNRGFSIAKGEICAWMNADDYYLADVFEQVARLYEKDPSVHFIYGDCLKIHESGSKPPTIEPRPRPDETFESLRTRGNSFDLCFFTKHIFDKVGPLDETLKYCLDLDFWFKIFAHSKVTYIPLTIGAFRLWEGSKTMTQQKKFAAERRLLAQRYGGNRIPAKKIYQLRSKLPFMGILKKAAPSLYQKAKVAFYRLIDLLKYKSNNQ